MKFSATSKQSKGTAQDQMHIVPYDQKWYPINKVSILTQEHIGKIEIVYKSKHTAKKF